MRAVVDPNVIISALISSKGAPAAVLAVWRDGAFDLVVSPRLVTELRRALAYPKVRRRLDAEDARLAEHWLAASAIHLDDPTEYTLSVRSRDPGDDYLLALAAAADAVLVTGDLDLLELGEELPIHTARRFITSLRT